MTVLEELRLAFLNFEIKADDGTKTFNMFGRYASGVVPMRGLFLKLESEISTKTSRSQA